MPIPSDVAIDTQNYDYVKNLIDLGHDMQDINGAGYFTNQFLYPKKEEFGITKTCEYCKSVYKDEEAQDRFREELDKYRTEDLRLYNMFKASLIYSWDLDPANEKTEKLFNIAWDKGHASGYYDVIQEFNELVELIK